MKVVVDLVKEAWDEIKPEALRKSWEKIIPLDNEDEVLQMIDIGSLLAGWLAGRQAGLPKVGIKLLYIITCQNVLSPQNLIPCFLLFVALLNSIPTYL